jgi:hypothetical protein
VRDEINMIASRPPLPGVHRVGLRAVMRQRAAALRDLPSRSIRIRGDMNVVMSGHDALSMTDDGDVV